MKKKVRKNKHVSGVLWIFSLLMNSERERQIVQLKQSQNVAGFRAKRSSRECIKISVDVFDFVCGQRSKSERCTTFSLCATF